MSGIGAPDLAAVFPWKFTSPIPNLSAVRRRFLGIVGLGAANVTAVLRVIQSLVPPKITLRMVLSNAKLASNADDGTRAEKIGEVPVVTNAVVSETEGIIHVDDPTPDQLAAIGFEKPNGESGELSNKVILVKRGDGSEYEKATLQHRFVTESSGVVYIINFHIDGELSYVTGQEALEGVHRKMTSDADAAQQASAPTSSSPFGAPPVGISQSASAAAAGPRSETDHPLSNFPHLYKIFGNNFPAELLAQMTPADELCKVITLDPNGIVPPEARTPENSISARLFFCNEQIIRAGNIKAFPPAANPTWEAVHDAARRFKFEFRSVVLQPPQLQQPALQEDLGSSYGRNMANHTMFSVAANRQNEWSGLSSNMIAAQQAATRVDREPNVGARPLRDAAAALIPLSSHGSDTEKISNLGIAMRDVDPSLARLGAAQGNEINVNSSESLSNVARCLASAHDSLSHGMAQTLRAKLRTDPINISTEREEQLKKVSNHLFHGKLNSLFESDILGSKTSNKSLFYSLEQGDPEKTYKVLRALQATVNLFDPTTGAGKEGFFTTLEAEADTLVSIHKTRHSDVAAFLRERTAELDKSFRNFYSAKVLLRPRFNSDLFDSKAVNEERTGIIQQAKADARVREALSLEFKNMREAETSQDDESTSKKSKRQKKEEEKLRERAKSVISKASSSTSSKPAGADQHKCYDGRIINKADYHILVNESFTGTPEKNRPDKAALIEFSRVNNKKCWDYCMRGECVRKGSTKECTFVHESL